jgi:hypothetical protein
MARWCDMLAIDPLPVLLAVEDEALHYFVRRDLADESVGPVEALWDLPEVGRILRRQGPDGSWAYPGKPATPDEDYPLLETYRQVGVLVEMYGFTRAHSALERAAEFFFSRQTDEGDIRGIIGSQYMPYYMGVIMARLIQAGYDDDPRIQRGFDWLIGFRQDDGGWASSMRTLGISFKEALARGPIQPDRTKPHQHLMTGMVLRAFAAHPVYRRHPAALRAAELLKARLLERDRYADRQDVAYWTRFQYPLWWPTLVTVLDCLAKMGDTRIDSQVGRALDWFIAHQGPDGLWPTGYSSGGKTAQAMLWIALSICRVLKAFYPDE